MPSTFILLGALSFDRYETFAFAVRPNSKALGATPGVGGPLDTAAEVNLNQLSLLGAPVADNFIDHEWDHSAQFNGTNMDRKYYWNLLMKAFGITPWDTTQTTYQVLK